VASHSIPQHPHSILTSSYSTSLHLFGRYGDIAPIQFGEKAFCVVYLVVICSTLYPAIIGEVTTLMNSPSLKQSGDLDVETLEQTEMYISANQLKPALATRVRRFVEYTAGLLAPDNPVETWLPFSLRSDINLAMHGRTLARIPLFSGAPEGFFRTLVSSLRLTNFLPGEYVYMSGDPACNLFLIRSASAPLSVQLTPPSAVLSRTTLTPSFPPP
jgi:hypothetical protein